MFICFLPILSHNSFKTPFYRNHLFHERSSELWMLLFTKHSSGRVLKQLLCLIVEGCLLLHRIAVVYSPGLISKHSEHAFLGVGDELFLYRPTKVSVKRVS
jgi:hypothetical protein